MILDALFGGRRAYGNNWNGAYNWPIGGRNTRAGVPVNEDTSLTYPAFWCGCRIISETESSLPLITYERASSDEASGRAWDTKHAGDYYLYDLLKVAPNPDMGSMSFRECRSLHMITWGNGFAEVEWDSFVPELRTRVVALWPIHASRVQPINERGPYPDLYRQGLRYLVKNADNSLTALMPDEMLHIPGIFPEDGIWGKSVVRYHRETIGMGKAIQLHGASYFGSGGQPRGIVYGNGLKDREARKNFRTEWKDMHGQPDKGEIAILPLDAKYEKISFSNEDGQYLETAKFSVDEVARILRLPAHKLSQYEKAASYASVEMAAIDFVVDFLPWLRRWEEQCNLKLILKQDRAVYFCEHNIGGLLRGDFKTRMDGYVQALMNGIMTINEVRRLENLNSIGPAGDVNYVQLNMTTAEQIMKGPAPMTGPVGSDGAALAFDSWTKEMMGKQRAEVRQLAGLSRERKAQYSVPPDSLAVRRGAVRDAVASVFERAYVKLAKALGRDLAKVTDLPGWVEEFSHEHGVTLADALAPMAALIKHTDETGGELWDTLAEAASENLRAAFDMDTRAKFTERLQTWPREMATDMAEEFVPEESQTSEEYQPMGGSLTVNVNGGGNGKYAEGRMKNREIAFNKERQELLEGFRADFAALIASSERKFNQLMELVKKAIDKPAAEMPTPIVNVEVKASDVIVHPEFASPEINIEVQPADVIVKEPKVVKVVQRVERDREGEMTGSTSEYHYERGE